MRSISGIKSVVFLYVILALLLAAALFFGALYTTYITTVDRYDGEAVNSEWPLQYAESFGQHIFIKDGIPQVSEAGRTALEKFNLWVQVLDDNGSQAAEYHKPAEIPKDYSLSELLEIADKNSYDGYTVFIIPTVLDGASYEYVIGFPLGISKVTTYYNSDRYIGGRPVAYVVVTGICWLILIVGLLYGLWITRHLAKITKSACAIAERTYTPERTGGAFGDAYKSLNRLDNEIRLSDEIRADADRMREEWITNITHDLKTPLSPIKGYAELLTDPDYSWAPEEIKKCGQIILKNAAYMEQLINDLKLTYQLESGVMPVKMETVNIAREVKEIVIDIANNPEYAGETIAYQCEENKILAEVDLSLLRRAISNIVINAVIHNAPGTEVTVSVRLRDDIAISIRDNGKGLAEEEIKNLFTRYYRGTNTEEKPQGSGLGLAISKQIVLFHCGSIEVYSVLGKGTDITIHLPKHAE